MLLAQDQSNREEAIKKYKAGDTAYIIESETQPSADNTQRAVFFTPPGSTMNKFASAHVRLQ